jgi:hypothetical protein
LLPVFQTAVSASISLRIRQLEINRTDIAQKAEIKGDEVFRDEGLLYDDLRAYLDA